MPPKKMQKLDKAVDKPKDESAEDESKLQFFSEKAVPNVIASDLASSSHASVFRFGSAFGVSSYDVTVPMKTSSMNCTNTITSISEICVGTSTKKIRGRVIFKSVLKSWTKDDKQGELFDIILQDKSGEIYLCCFQPELLPNVQVNKCVEINGFWVKESHPVYKKCSHQFELSSNSNTTIENLDEVIGHEYPPIVFNFKRWDELSILFPVNEAVDLLGICVHPGEIFYVGPNKIPKRNILLVDKSNLQFTLSLWRENATSLTQSNFFSIVVGNGVLAEYEGKKYVNTIQKTLIWIGPELEEAIQLMDWFQKQQLELQ